MPAREFGPIAFKAVREEMIAKRWARPTVNKHCGRIRRIVRWGVESELLPADRWETLRAVRGLSAVAHDVCPVEHPVWTYPRPCDRSPRILHHPVYHPTEEEGIGLLDVPDVVTVHLFIRDDPGQMVDAPIQSDADRIPKGSHSVLLKLFEFLREANEYSFRPTDVAEPVNALVIDHFSDNFRIELSETGERIVYVYHGEHDAKVAEGVHRSVAVIGDYCRREEPGQLEPAVTVRCAHHGDLDSLAV